MRAVTKVFATATASVTALAMAAAVAAGCGGGGGTRSGAAGGARTTTVRGGVSGGAGAAINLRAGDLIGPEWSSLGSEQQRTVRHGNELARCAYSGAPHVSTVRYTSPFLRRVSAPPSGSSTGGREGARSAVFVMPSPRDASADVAAARRCVGRQRGPTFVPLTPGVSGLDAVGQRWTIRLPAPETGGAPAVIYKDTFVFTAGSRVVTLATVGTPHPFPHELERRLLALLHERAAAAGAG